MKFNLKLLPAAAGGGVCEMASDRGALLRATALSLHAERNVLEGRLLLLLDALGPLARGPLVDAEGFPVAGVDLYAVTAQRQEVARLRTDIAQKSREMEAALLEVHAAALGSGEGSGGGGGCRVASGGGGGGGGAAPPPPIGEGPFALAVLGEVAEGGPAGEGGLQPGDYVMSWGGLSGGGIGLRDLALRARACAQEERALHVHVLRGGAERLLEVRPRAWAGEGILGCRLLPCG